MQIKINLRVIIFVLFFYFTGQIDLYIIIMIFAAIHEIGHIITTILLGLKVQKLEIMPMGFCMTLKVDTKNYNKKIAKASILTVKKLVIAIAGPMVNIIFIATFLFIKNSETLIYANTLIFIFNMIPIFPLDGGRILKYICCIFLGKRKALDITNLISNITSIILTIISICISLIFKNFAYIIVSAYVCSIVIKENKVYKLKKKMYEILENNIEIRSN